MGITDKISHAAERKAFETIPDGKWAHYTQRLIRENDPLYSQDLPDQRGL